MAALTDNFRVGLGTDRHRLIAGEGLRLGGIFIACAFSAQAHSDGDVLLHALTDAILGAMGGGDIGEIFPDTDAQNAGRNSADFVLEAVRLMREAGFSLLNVDAVVQLQTPKLSPYKKNLREKIAALCGCEINAVNVKAKTGEGVGPVGRSEAIDAQVVVMLERLRVSGGVI